MSVVSTNFDNSSRICLLALSVNTSIILLIIDCFLVYLSSK